MPTLDHTGRKGGDLTEVSEAILCVIAPSG